MEVILYYTLIGAYILIVTHDMTLARNYSDPAAFLVGGRLVDQT